jgi:large subunit ribosomal protein L13
VATYAPKPAEIVRNWHVIDADGLVLGRLATEVARLLRGKHQPFFAPNCDTGDHVIIVNAAKIVMTSNKASQKFYYRHSGYPGGLRSTSYADLLDADPVALVERAIAGMIPKNTLGRQQLAKLKVYAGAEHPHAAQQPTPYDTSSIRRAG